MVYDPHEKIRAYQDLSEKQAACIQQINDSAVYLELTLKSIESGAEGVEPDVRWLNIARTDLQKGFMALVRSIAKPTEF